MPLPSQYQARRLLDLVHFNRTRVRSEEHIERDVWARANPPLRGLVFTDKRSASATLAAGYLCAVPVTLSVSSTSPPPPLSSGQSQHVLSPTSSASIHATPHPRRHVVPSYKSSSRPTQQTHSITSPLPTLTPPTPTPTPPSPPPPRLPTPPPHTPPSPSVPIPSMQLDDLANAPVRADADKGAIVTPAPPPHAFARAESANSHMSKISSAPSFGKIPEPLSADSVRLESIPAVGRVSSTTPVRSDPYNAAQYEEFGNEALITHGYDELDDVDLDNDTPSLLFRSIGPSVSAINKDPTADHDYELEADPDAMAPMPDDPRPNHHHIFLPPNPDPGYTAATIPRQHNLPLDREQQSVSTTYGQSSVQEVSFHETSNDSADYLRDYDMHYVDHEPDVERTDEYDLSSTDVALAPGHTTMIPPPSPPPPPPPPPFPPATTALPGGTMATPPPPPFSPPHDAIGSTAPAPPPQFLPSLVPSAGPAPSRPPPPPQIFAVSSQLDDVPAPPSPPTGGDGWYGPLLQPSSSLDQHDSVLQMTDPARLDEPTGNVQQRVSAIPSKASRTTATATATATDRSFLSTSEYFSRSEYTGFSDSERGLESDDDDSVARSRRREARGGAAGAEMEMANLSVSEVEWSDERVVTS